MNARFEVLVGKVLRGFRWARAQSIACGHKRLLTHEGTRLAPAEEGAAQGAAPLGLSPVADLTAQLQMQDLGVDGAAD